MYLNNPTLKYSDFFKLIFKSSHIFMHSLLSGYKCVVFLSCYHMRRSCMSHYTLKRLRVSLYKNGNPIKAICIKLIVCLFTWMWSEKKLSLLPYFPSWRHKKNAIKVTENLISQFNLNRSSQDVEIRVTLNCFSIENSAGINFLDQF